jgi:hypothetical protein
VELRVNSYEDGVWKFSFYGEGAPKGELIAEFGDVLGYSRPDDTAVWSSGKPASELVGKAHSAAKRYLELKLADEERARERARHDARAAALLARVNAPPQPERDWLTLSDDTTPTPTETP